MQINSYAQAAVHAPLAKAETSAFAKEQNLSPVIEKARDRLLNYLKTLDPTLQETDLEWIGLDFRVYPDGSLGFYEPGYYFTCALVNGFELRFNCQGKEYTVDTNGSRFVLRGIQAI